MKNSITFRKLFLLFSTIIIPFFLFGMLLLQRNNTSMQNRTFDSIQSKTDLTAQSLTYEIEQIYHTATEVAGQANLRKLASSNYPVDAYETAKNLLLVQEQQTSITNANQYIDNFVVYYKNREQAYNSKCSQKGSFFYFTQEEYQKLADSRSFSDFLILHDKKLTEIIFPATNSGFFIRVDLSSQAISSLLEDAFSEYGPYYLLDALDSSYQLTNLAGEQLAQLPDDSFPDRLMIDGTQYYCFSSSLPYGEGQLHFFFSEEQLFSDVKVYQHLNLCFGLFALFACCFFLWSCYTIIHKPIQALIKAFDNINRQNYRVRILSRRNSDFSYLYQEFNHMAQQLGTLIEKDYQQQLLLNKAELKQLQAQINPHFLYNSFLLLRRMIQDELYEEAQKMSDTLGLYFKYITRNSQEYMPLSQEYHHAMLYCEIQQLRFEERIRLETDSLPEEYSHILVPKLIIQPILENAFNYGLRDKVDDGLVKVTISDNSSELIISIEDNGNDLSDRQLEELQMKLKAAIAGNSLLEMTGILNIQRRLAIYSNGSSFLKASRSPLGGLCIQLFLPIHQFLEKEQKIHDENIVSG